MARKKKTKSGAYHIADTIWKPPRLLNGQGEFTQRGDALVFITPSEAGEYMRSHKLNASGIYSIIRCECSDVQQRRHTYKQ